MTNQTIEQTVDLFCETVSLKIRLFHKLFPQGEHNHLTGLYIEELVRTFIANWIHPFEIVAGSMLPWDACSDELLISAGMSAAIKKPRQLDGIVYDSSLGPYILREGGFTVVHPAFSRGIVEIKKSFPKISKFYRHLCDLHAQFLYPFDGRMSQVFAVVIRHSNPEKANRVPKRKYKYYDYSHVDHCPIFILFDNEYQPQKVAIYKLIEFLFTGEIRNPRRVLSSYTTA